jgi:NAD(P)-dependent dehydrogenase (short-subunit alcohol dehydrogenase family)
VEYLLADLTEQEQVRRLAAEFRARHERLDVLVNNAGAMFFDHRRSREGVEMTMALNHLAYFLLTNLLLDRLNAGASSRVVNVASEAHRWARALDDEALEGRRSLKGFRAYAQSKLANLLFTRELGRRLEGTGTTVNALHPGFVATSIFAGNGVAGWVMRRGASLFAIGPERGAETSIYLATSSEVEGQGGGYYYRKAPLEPSRAAQDEAAARRLWSWSERVTGLAAPA